MEDQEKQFIKGFNNGYILAKHEPELAAMLIKTPNAHSEYFQGLVSGKQEYEIGKTRERSDISKDTPSKEINKDIDKER